MTDPGNHKPISEFIGPQVYEFYGLRVRSDIVLPAPISQNLLPPYDIEVQFSQGESVPTHPPAGGLLAKLDHGDKPLYTLTDTGDGYILSFPQTCEFWISYNLRQVDVRLFPGVHPDTAGILLINSVPSCILTLKGKQILHASAVEMGGRALAFLGSSGMGKSTLAALLCAMGAQLITDDLLRLQPNGKAFHCFPGTGEIRLRKGDQTLAEKFSETLREDSPDGHRITLKLYSSQSMPPLSAMVIPRPSPHCKALRLERLPPSRAIPYLMAYSKVQELQQREYIQRRLYSSAQIASTVPIFEAELPWGIPSLQEIAPSLIRGVGLELSE